MTCTSSYMGYMDLFFYVTGAATAYNNVDVHIHIVGIITALYIVSHYHIMSTFTQKYKIFVL